MVMLMVITAIASPVLDNVTIIMLVAPVTLVICDRLEIAAQPFLIAEVLASQHRRRRNADRRPAQHHHRQPGRADLQRLPGQHGTRRSWSSSSLFVLFTRVLFRKASAHNHAASTT